MYPQIFLDPLFWIPAGFHFPNSWELNWIFVQFWTVKYDCCCSEKQYSIIVGRKVTYVGYSQDGKRA
jgi:hypothetical protein